MVLEKLREDKTITIERRLLDYWEWQFYPHLERGLGPKLPSALAKALIKRLLQLLFTDGLAN